MNRVGLGRSAAQVVVRTAESDLGADVVHLAVDWQPAASRSSSDIDFVVVAVLCAVVEAALTEIGGYSAGFGVVG